LIGFAHYLLHRSTWAQVGLLPRSLFVDHRPAAARAGRALIAVEAAAGDAGASRSIG
jgi:hypothetical protein